MLPYTKNPNYIPYHYLKTKPISFTFYNPYTNTIPSEKLNRRFSHCLCSYVPQYFESKENQCTYSILNDVSQDSAICMDDNLYDYRSLPDESCNISEFSSADSGISISNIIRTNDVSAVQQNNFPVTSTMLHSVSSSSLLLCNDKKINNNISNAFSNYNISDKNIQQGLYNFKSSTLCKKRITEHINKQYPDKKTHLLKFYKNIQCTRNSFNLNKKIISPKRYVKWQKAKSCITIHKISSLHKFKLRKIHSHPNLLKQHDLELNDSLLYNQSPTSMAKSKSFSNTCKLSSSILSKFSHLNFSPMLKQYVVISPVKQIPEIQKQKYTPLPSPLPIPAKVAKLSTSEYGSRNTFTSHESYLNISSKRCILKDDHVKLDKQKDKPLSLVFLFF